MNPAIRIAPAGAARLLAGALFCAPCALRAADAPADGPLPPALSAPATNVIETVLAGYAAVSNLSCTVRRSLPGGDAQMVSRVIFARGGRLSSETILPERRRALVDGQFAWTLSPGGKKPRKVPFDEQSPAQKASVLCLPASPEESLRALDGTSGLDVPPASAEFARTVSFRFRNDPPDSGKRALVSMDAAGRIREIDVFSDAGARWRIASFSWDSPVEAIPGVWLFGKETAESAIDGKPVSAVSRFEAIRANSPIDESAFDAEKVFGAK